ncbi:MAG: glycosyltransferase, partial [Candidatus Eremiobacteraeota bacterium]|nr:glycosyltransferase [Candidatus Eremiobacteraeota bacterium]
VLHCPVDVERFTVGAGEGDYFIVISRLLPYKRIELAIAACALANVPLYVVGEGPARHALSQLARGTTTSMLGFVPDRQLNYLLGNAVAAILPGEEDFGLVPLEAAAAGRPTIAFRRGGALETIVQDQTGVFFDAPLAESLAQAIRRFEPKRFEPHALRRHAESFAPGRFKERLREIVDCV